jgi:hypothetical protein
MMEYGKLKLHQPLYGGETRTFTTWDPSPEILELFKRVEFTDLTGRTKPDNYEFSEKMIRRTICWSVTMIGDEPVLGSLAWDRKMYNNMARVGTRYCINPKYSFLNFGKGTDGMRLDVIDHIVQQIEFCKKLGYEDFFLAREDKSNGRRSRKIARMMSKHTGIDWKCSDEKILVSTPPDDPSCWQYVIYNNRKEFNYEGITTP